MVATDQFLVFLVGVSYPGHVGLGTLDIGSRTARALSYRGPCHSTALCLFVQDRDGAGGGVVACTIGRGIAGKEVDWMVSRTDRVVY